MFRPSYLREGQGIEKDTPPKHGISFVAETLIREFWQIVKMNALFVLTALPIFTFGAARAAMARCSVNMVRDVPNDVWTDFFRAIRQDFARNAAIGFVELALTGFSLVLLYTSAASDRFGTAVLAMLLLCVTEAFFQNLWPLLAAIDLPFSHTAKNACLLCLLRPVQTIAAVVLNAVLLLPCLMLLPLSIPVCLLLPFGLSSFFSSALCWSGCKRYIILPEAVN